MATGSGTCRESPNGVEYLARLGVDAVWLSPFLRLPAERRRLRRVADYRDVDPVFGRLEDADKLIATAHDYGIRVIIDLVPNHSSSEHPWFQAALRAAPGSPERARYIFRDGKGASGERAAEQLAQQFRRRGLDAGHRG